MRAVMTVNVKPRIKEPASTPRKYPTEMKKARGSKLCPGPIWL